MDSIAAPALGWSSSASEGTTMIEKTLSRLLSLVDGLLALPAALVAYVREWLRFRRLAGRFPDIKLSSRIMRRGINLPGIDYALLLVDLVIRFRAGQFWIGPERILFINDPEDIQVFMQNQKNQYKPRFFYRMASDGVGDGIFCRSGERWTRFHKILAPTFHQEKLNSYLPVFNMHSNTFIELLKKQANGEAFDIRTMTARFAFDVLCGTILGVPSKELTEDSGVIHNLDILQLAIGRRMIRPWLYPSIIFYTFSSMGKDITYVRQYVQKLLEKMIRQRVEIITKSSSANDVASNEYDSGTKLRYGLLDTLLLQKANGTPITDKEIEEEVQTSMTAGFDTVFLTIIFALYLVAKHPNVQDKIVQELVYIFGEEKRVDVTVEKLKEMSYLEMVIKETLRLYPPGWFITRRAGEDVPLKSCDLVIPEGAQVLFSLRSVHMDPRNYPDPEVFDPERFSPENSAQRNPCAFVPFARGQRACIARKFAMMEMKTALSKILWNFQVMPDPNYKPKLFYGITTIPKNGMWIKIRRRSLEDS